jgi:REP element-mobilizing transposase RayT
MFGDIVGGEVCLNRAGEIVQFQWQMLTQRFSGIILDSYVVMPNHLHGILTLEEPTSLPDCVPYTAQIPERFRLPKYESDKAKIQNSGLNCAPALGGVIRTFKGAVTYLVRKQVRADFAWQSNYYEHIVRNTADLDRVRRYILNNPAQWAEDRLRDEQRIDE